MKKYPKYTRFNPSKAVLPMTTERARKLLAVLKRGTAVSIGRHWEARFIKALEYILQERKCDHKHEIEIAKDTHWCTSCGRVSNALSTICMYPSHEGDE